MTPAVSVLLPVRDGAATLPACLDSLRRQSLQAHEVIAVDDGSGDGSADLLAAAAAQDPRLRLVKQEPRGLVAALNRALSLARGPLLARMDADDVAHPERLRLQVERLAAEPTLTVVGCRVEPGPGAGEGMRAYVDWQNGLLEHEAIVRDLWVESPLAHPSVTLRTAALHALRGYRDFAGPEDYDLWLRGHGAGWRFAKCPETLLRWADRPRRLTRTDPRYAPERFQALKLDWLERLHLRGRALVVWGAGPVGKSWARALRARGHALEAFVEVDPRKIGQVIHGAPVLPVEEARRFPGALHLAAVGQHAARERIRAEVERLGLGSALLAVA